MAHAQCGSCAQGYPWDYQELLLTEERPPSIQTYPLFMLATGRAMGNTDLNYLGGFVWHKGLIHRTDECKHDPTKEAYNIFVPKRAIAVVQKH